MLGEALNNPRGLSVSAERYKLHRSRFHKANDQVIASYAAVIWWSKYVKHYLSEEQRSEMADKGRLSSPLVLKWEELSTIPALADVDVPLGPGDVQRALEFLAQAKLVSFKRRAGAYQIELKEDRLIRVPADGPVPKSAARIFRRRYWRGGRQTKSKLRLLRAELGAARLYGVAVHRGIRGSRCFSSSPTTWPWKLQLTEGPAQSLHSISAILQRLARILIAP